MPRVRVECSAQHSSALHITRAHRHCSDRLKRGARCAARTPQVTYVNEGATSVRLARRSSAQPCSKPGTSLECGWSQECSAQRSSARHSTRALRHCSDCLTYVKAQPRKAQLRSAVQQAAGYNAQSGGGAARHARDQGGEGALDRGCIPRLQARDHDCGLRSCVRATARTGLLRANA